MKKILEKINKFAWGGAIALSPGDIPVLTPRRPGTVSADAPKNIIVNVIEYGLWFLGALAFVFVIYGGILYLTSGGDSDKTKKARDTLLYAVIGVIVIVLALVIVQWAKSIGTSPTLAP
jgi:hypothetical protein